MSLDLVVQETPIRQLERQLQYTRIVVTGGMLLGVTLALSGFRK